MSDNVDTEVAELRQKAAFAREMREEWKRLDAEAEERRKPRAEREAQPETPQEGDTSGLKINYVDTLDPEVRRMVERYAESD